MGPHTVLPITIISIHISWISSIVWNLLSFKGDFSFGKSQKLQGAKSGLYGDRITWVIWCFAKILCAGHGAWVDLLWWSCQLPVAHGYGLLSNLTSFHWGMFKLNATLDTDLLLYLLSHFECDGHAVHMLTQGDYLPHWLVQWSWHCSCMCIPVHSPWLPGYTDVMQTVLVVLTMAGLFSDRPSHDDKNLKFTYDETFQQSWRWKLVQSKISQDVRQPIWSHFSLLKKPES